MMAQDYILQMKHVRKTFGALVANDDINFDVKAGTVHALIGENGAGKSTLMRILTHIYKPDSGEIWFQGKKTAFRTSLEAAQAGIGMVHQEFMLYNNLTVFENIILGFERKKWVWFIDRKASRAAVEQICATYRFNIPLDKKIKDLPVAMLQQVEIVKALYRGAEVLILDEPTSVLTPSGIQGLFDAIRFLVQSGKTIIFISHKLKEVFEIADAVTVLKDGKVVSTVLPSEVNERQLASLMVGREVILQAHKVTPHPGETVLSVKNLSVRDKDKVLRVKNVSFEIHAGEIVGIAGVAGSGQQQLVEAIFGLRAPEEGDILFERQNIIKQTPSQRRCLGIGYVPQDRLGAGVNPNAAIWESAIMGYHIAHGFKSKWLLDYKAIEQFCNKIVQDFNVKRQKNTDRVRTLSGGNIQKLVVGREFLQAQKLLIIEDPTRGIDVGAIEFIWAKIIELAAAGAAVLVVSHELGEVLQLSDRVLVIYNGEISDGGRYQEYTEEQIGLLMLGGKLDAVEA